MHLIVLAKAPVAGHVKTRLCPPCTPAEAAAIASAALAETLDRAVQVAGVRTVLALAGEAGAFVPPGIDVIPQRGDGLAARIAAAFEDIGGPSLLIGMDTPQVSAARLASAVGRLATPGVDAVLGPALDGGWWALGLRRPDRRTLVGVPMSDARTCACQRERLRSLGLRVEELPEMRDVDTAADARLVADAIPGSRFAHAVEVSAIGRGVAV